MLLAQQGQPQSHAAQSSSIDWHHLPHNLRLASPDHRLERERLQPLARERFQPPAVGLQQTHHCLPLAEPIQPRETGTETRWGAALQQPQAHPMTLGYSHTVPQYALGGLPTEDSIPTSTPLLLQSWKELRAGTKLLWGKYSALA